MEPSSPLNATRLSIHPIIEEAPSGAIGSLLKRAMEENVSSEEEYNRSKKRISSLKTEADLYPFLSRALMRPLDAIDTCVLDLS